MRSGADGRWVRVLAAALASAQVALWGQSHALAQSRPPDLPEIRLEDANWQALPESVNAVYVGPDQRPWYRFRHPAMKEKLDQVKQIIEREFRSPSPRLYGASVALFEPGGRVWLITHSQETLLGYDGREWIQRDSNVRQTGRFFIGNPPNHAAFYYAGCNRYLDGKAFLVGSQGVHCFDGRQWSYQEMVATWPGSTNYLVTVPEVDGKGLLAYLPVPKDARVVWRWREGQWGQIALPCKAERSRLIAVVPWADGLLVSTSFGELFTRPFDTGQMSQAVARLIGQLADGNWRRREQATEALVAMGRPIRDQLAAAAAETANAEVRARLELVLEKLSGPIGPVRLGRYDLTKPAAAWYGHDGTVYVTAQEIVHDDEKLGAGLVVGSPDGAWTRRGGEELREAWRVGLWIPRTLAVRAGQAVWIGGHDKRPVARLLSLAKCDFIDETPETGFAWPVAVKDDGTLFVAKHDPTHGGTIMVYRPKMPSPASRPAGP